MEWYVTNNLEKKCEKYAKSEFIVKNPISLLFVLVGYCLVLRVGWIATCLVYGCDAVSQAPGP